ncbi:MAG: carboxypeptidase M32 [Halobacteriales archaeon]|nr:carboxypeptidase M32 [Halobacteriales archaeon]
MSTDAAAPDAYEALLEHYERYTALGTTQQLLSWDQQVMMPEGGTPARSLQQSAMSGLSHEVITDDAVADRLEELEAAELDDERAAVVREIRRAHDRSAAVPRELIETISEKTTEALGVWERAREEDDFDQFAPALEELVELRREYANHIDPDRDPYAVLFEGYEPYLPLETADAVLEELREALVPLVDAVAESDVEVESPFAGGTYDPDKQEALSRDLLDDLGYDWERGRLDTSTHPFTSGNPFDARITTRFHEDDPLDALMATIHEFGHASYELGLPGEAFGSPLGESRDLTVHESQSRFWENHVGRTRAFWRFATPTVTDHLGVDADPEAFYRGANEVYDDNPIRVEADELTYHLHIVLRYEIERDLVRGELDVADVPQVWNDKMEEYLGFRPETDAEGCLQDIHWSHGNFGYFPTYSLGSVLAAQLDHHLRADLGDVDAMVEAGEFAPLYDWMTEHVHRHGARYTTPDLVREATGEAYTADHFVDYVTGKYGELYDL